MTWIDRLRAAAEFAKRTEPGIPAEYRTTMIPVNAEAIVALLDWLEAAERVVEEARADYVHPELLAAVDAYDALGGRE